MQHPNFETRHPLLSDEQQDMGFDPLHNLNKNRSRGGSLDSTTYSQSESTFLSYRKEWDDLFLHSNYLAHIRQAGINGRLRSSRFRSVCWKLYLEVLPEDKSQWINKTKELRSHYEKIKETHITNPRKAAGQQDLVVNNPLSQDEGSLWNKFFQDKELRSMIKQDVMRTFPEMRYFQEEDVRTKLTDILFCYARENEQLLYKQGMHELLAPIVFVLHCDHQAFQHASETANPSEEMRSMLNPEFHEHDAYAMFSQLMETAEPWFSCYEREVRKGKDEMLSSIPFARPQDTGPSVAIVTKVNRIQDQLVKKHDIELYMHLNRLEIAPQIYGIRWVRLLYGREFLLQDLLVVWDALFADSVTLDLVDYTFVAMLLYIRDALIASNFQTCLGLLMHYPPVGDIHALLHKALFLRDPKNNPRPVNYQFQQNLDYYKTRGADLVNKTRAKTAPLNINKVSSSLLNFGRKLIAPAIAGGSGVGVQPINSEVHASSIPGFATTPPPPRPLSDPPSTNAPLQTQSHPQSPHYRLLKSESMPVHLSKGQTSRTLSSSPSTESLCHGAASPPLPLSRGPSDVSTSSPPLSATKKESFFAISRSRSHSKSMGKRESDEDLEAQVSFLQGQINDLEAMSKYCAKMMNTHICKIQEVILQEHLEKEDEVLVSLAGLKQIKDILKGSLRFNQSQLEAEENEEITIADDHYTSTHAAMQQQHAAMQQQHAAMQQQHAAMQQQQQQQANSHRQHAPAAAAAAHLGQHQGRQGGDSDQDGTGGSADDDEEEEKEEEDEQVASSSLGSDGGKNWDDYILVSQDGDLQASEGGGGGEGGGAGGGGGGGGDDGGGLGSERSSTTTPPPVRQRGGGRSLVVRMEPEGAAAGPFHDPLMVGTAGTSGSSSPDEGSTHSKDSDFTIVNPNDL